MVITYKRLDICKVRKYESGLEPVIESYTFHHNPLTWPEKDQIAHKIIEALKDDELECITLTTQAIVIEEDLQ